MYDGKVRDSGFKYQELQDKSGTETHIPSAVAAVAIHIEAKKARAVLVIVPAAAQRQALRAVPHPDGTHRIGRVHGIQGEQFQQGRHRDAAFRRHGLKRMSGIHLAIPVFSKGYRPKQGKVVP